MLAEWVAAHAPRWAELVSCRVLSAISAALTKHREIVSTGGPLAGRSDRRRWLWHALEPFLERTKINDGAERLAYSNRNF